MKTYEVWYWNVSHLLASVKRSAFCAEHAADMVRRELHVEIYEVVPC
jgi:hypothetical protein